jgi:hypothetical protein
MRQLEAAPVSSPKAWPSWSLGGGDDDEDETERTCSSSTPAVGQGIGILCGANQRKPHRRREGGVEEGATGRLVMLGHQVERKEGAVFLNSKQKSHTSSHVASGASLGAHTLILEDGPEIPALSHPVLSDRRKHSDSSLPARSKRDRARQGSSGHDSE